MVKIKRILFSRCSSNTDYPSVCVGELIDEVGGTGGWANHWRLDVGSEVVGLVEVAEFVVDGGCNTGWE